MLFHTLLPLPLLKRTGLTFVTTGRIESTEDEGLLRGITKINGVAIPLANT